MELVAHRLSNIAQTEKDRSAANLFGRTAFNRYYYAAFLEVRSALKNLNPDWSRPAHKAVPELLTGQVLEKIKKQISTWEKTGVLAAGRASALRTQANGATSGLADLLKSAREVRRVADYEPETLCEVTPKGVVLGTDSLHAAKQWPERVRAHTSLIQKIYNELGLT